jgi:hypothetical protein
MREIPASMSVSGLAYQKVTDWLNQPKGPLEKCFKQITAEVAYVGIMLLGAMETVARGVYVLALKGIAQCKESAEKKAFLKKHVVPAGENFLLNASVMSAAALGLKDNLCKISCSQEERVEIIHVDATIDQVTMFYFKTFPGPLRAMGFRVPN